MHLRLHAYWPLIRLTAFSWFLRIFICVRGGQLFWGDENRYAQSFSFLKALIRLDLDAACDAVLRTSHHGAFVLVGLISAIPHSLLVLLTRPATWDSFLDTYWFSASILALASVANIALVYAIALRSGAELGEAWLAAILMAGANTMFYYSRHVLPYDWALLFCLLSLWLGLKECFGRRESLLCGTTLGLAFMTHHGHWPLVFTTAIFLSLYRVRSAQEWLRRCLLMGLTFSLLPVALNAVSLAQGKGLYTQRMGGFLDWVLLFPQGDYAEGWSLPWVFLWHAEHGVFFLWIAASFLCLYWGWHEKRWNKGLVWLSLALGVYSCLVLSSTILEIFMVYGRTTREMVPFFCLATAYSLCRIKSFFPLLFRRIGIAVFFFMAAGNFWGPLRQKFPREFERDMLRVYHEAGRAHTLVDLGPPPKLGENPYVLVNVRPFYPIRGMLPLPKGDTIVYSRHPLEYLPYQYEAYSPVERRILRSAEISMRVILLRINSGSS